MDASTSIVKMESNLRKRQSLHSSSDEPKAKRLDVQTLKLVDLNEDVLEEIFSYLDMADLINVVKNDDVYLNCTRKTFKRKYRHTFIRIPMCNEYPITRQCFMQNAELLRFFGEQISCLQVCVNDYSPMDRRTFHLVVTRCRNTLTELHISYPSEKFKFNKSFPKVRKLTFSNGNLDLSCDQLVRMFPSLEKLVFDCIDEIGWLLKSGRKIASLKRLKIGTSDAFYDGYLYHMQDLHNFIAANTQLNEICLTLTEDNIHTFDDEQLPTLIDEIVPDELISVKLNIHQNEDGHSTPLTHLKIRNDRIAHLELYFDELTEQIRDYVAECVNIQTLTFGTIQYYRNPLLPNNGFKGTSWTNLKQFGFLTTLEILLPVFGTEHLFNIAQEAIKPFVKQVKSINSIRVLLKVYGQHTVSPIDVINDLRSNIDLNTWSFTQNVSSDKISFALTKSKD